MPPLLRIDGLCHAYGDVVALDGVSLAVEPGRVEALLGPNGAGKTTLIRAVTTLLVPNAGVVEVGGVDARDDPASVRRAVALSGQQVALDMAAPGAVNLRTFGRLLGLKRGERERRCAELVETFELGDVIDRPVATYSGGEQRRLDLAVAMLRRPSLLLLDEPTVGLDPYHRRGVWQLVRGLARSGVTVLLTTQYLEEADELADHVTIIQGGRVIAADEPAALKDATGGAVLTLCFDGADTARDVSRALGSDRQGVAHRDDQVAIRVKGGGEEIPGLLHRLYEGGYRPTGLQLREPTLDDAFLLLTGQVAGDPRDAALGARSRS